MPKFTRKITFTKKPSFVYQYISNFDLQKLWIKELVKVEYLNQSNTNFNLYLKEGNKISKYSGKILKSIENQELSVLLSNNSFESKTNYILTTHNGITTLKYEVEMMIKSTFGKIMFFLLGYLFSLIVLKNQMTALKKIVEEASSTIN